MLNTSYNLLSEAGLLSYRVRPSQTQPPKGLLILLHGLGSDETFFLAALPYLDPELLIVTIQGPTRNSPTQPHAWFEVYFSPGKIEINAKQAEESRLQLIKTIQFLQQKYQISPQKTIVTGFSQGGMMSSAVALTEPNIMTAFAMLSSRILTVIIPKIADKSALHHLEAFVGHGKYDQILPVEDAYQTDTYLTDLDIKHEFHIYDAGHELTMPELKDFLSWVNRQLDIKD